MEFVSDNNMLRFLEESEVRVIKMSNARLGGRFEKDLYVVSKNSTVSTGFETPYIKVPITWLRLVPH